MIEVYPRFLKIKLKCVDRFFSRIKKDNGRLSKISIKDKKIKVYPYFPAPVFFNKTFSIPKTIFGAISQRRAAGGSPGWTRRPLSLRWTPFTNEGGAGAEGGGRGGWGRGEGGRGTGNGVSNDGQRESREVQRLLFACRGGEGVVQCVLRRVGWGGRKRKRLIDRLS